MRRKTGSGKKKKATPATATEKPWFIRRRAAIVDHLLAVPPPKFLNAVAHPGEEAELVAVMDRKILGW